MAERRYIVSIEVLTDALIDDLSDKDTWNFDGRSCSFWEIVKATVREVEQKPVKKPKARRNGARP